MSQKNSRKGELTAPTEATKPIGARFSSDTASRMNTVATVLSERLKTKIKKSNVLEMCVSNHLPVLEKEYGIDAPKK